jgi:outer membrane protein assembly factor BamB
MKQPKILFLIIIALLSLMFASCISGRTQLARGWSGTTVHDGIVYVGTVDGRVVAVNSSTQSQQWSYSTDPPAAIYTTALVNGDLVYIGTYSGQVYALTIIEGTDRWVYPRSGSIGSIVGSPVIANETIYVSSSDGMLYALDIKYGDFKWKSEPLANKLWTSPTVMGDTLYVSTFDGNIYALSVETGTLLDWAFESEAGFASTPVIYEDIIYVGSFDRHLYAVKIGSDTPMWTFPQEKPADNWFWASPIVNEGIVYAGCLDGRVYTLDAKTGEELWEFDAGDPIVSSPVLMDNLLIVVDESGTVYVFDLSTVLEDEAVPLKAISIGDDVDVKSSFCAQEGLVYIRDEDNWIHVVDIDKGEVSWKVSLTIEE